MNKEIKVGDIVVVEWGTETSVYLMTKVEGKIAPISLKGHAAGRVINSYETMEEFKQSLEVLESSAVFTKWYCTDFENLTK